MPDPTKITKPIKTMQDLIDNKLISLTPTYKAPREFNVGNTDLGNSKYDEGIPLALVNNLNTIRADKQPWTHQATRSVLGIAGGGLLTVGEMAGYLLDLPSHITQFTNLINNEENLQTVESNFLSKPFKESKESLYRDFLPIYRKQPGKLIDFNDSGFYWEALRSVGESAVGFGITGMGAAALVKGAGAALRATRLANYNSALARGLGNIGAGMQEGMLGRGMTAYMTNFGEGKMMALELYENSKHQLMKEFTTNYEEQYGEPATPEKIKEFELDAAIQAGKGANYFMMVNKLFMATDYLQLNKIFGKTIKQTDNLATKPASTFLGKAYAFGKTQLKQAPKESFEEIGQNVGQMDQMFRTRQRLKKQGYKLPTIAEEEMSMADRLLEYATSEQALLEGAMGFLGGPIQYTVTQLPFQSKNNRYTDQLAQFDANEKYINTSMYNTISGKALSEAASEIFEENEEVSTDTLNDIAFTRQALVNFSAGTTANFRNSIESYKETEGLTETELKAIDTKLATLNQLELDYNTTYSKYADPAALMFQDTQSRLIDETLQKSIKQKEQVQADLNEVIDKYNNVSGTSYTAEQIINNPQELSTNIKGYLGAFEPITMQYIALDQNIKQLQEQSLEVSSNINQLKNSKNNAILSDFKRYFENVQSPSDETVKLGRELLKSTDSPFIKEYIKRRVDNLDDAIKASKANKVVKDKGGAEQAVADKAKKDLDRDNNNSPSVTSEPGIDEMFSPTNEEDYLEKLPNKTVVKEPPLAETEPLPNPDVIADFNIEEELDNMLYGNSDSKSITEAVTSFLENKVSAEQITPEEADSILERFVTPEQEDELAEGITPGFTVDAIQEEAVSKSNPVASVENDVKLAFSKNNDFKEFLNSNTDKTGVKVTYRLSQSDLVNAADRELIKKFNQGNQLNENEIGKIPIEAIIITKDGKQIVTSLYPVSGKGAGAIAETKLRKAILTSLNEGKIPSNTVVGQYSGAIVSDGVAKKLTLIDQLKDVKDIKLLFTNKEGRLINLDGTINRQHRNTILTKNNPWAGIFFVPIKTSNGKNIPLKVNTRKLSENELSVVGNILYLALKKEGVNNLSQPLSKFPKISEQLESYDLEYLGTEATLGKVLAHLVYLNKNAELNTDPTTSIYFDKGILYMGNKQFTYESITNDLSNILAIKDFLKNYRTRNVSVNKINEENGYKEFLVENEILNTDSAIGADGAPFQSSLDNSNDPTNRYKTKAIYVQNTITSKDNITSIKASNIKENTNAKLNKINKAVNKNVPTKTRLKVVKSSQADINRVLYGDASSTENKSTVERSILKEIQAKTLSNINKIINDKSKVKQGEC